MRFGSTSKRLLSVRVLVLLFAGILYPTLARAQTIQESDFVVSWEDDQDGNGSYQILARGFNADGSERFADRTVNSEGGGQQYAPAIAMDSAGNFVVAWEDDQDGNGSYQILARGFNADGSERFADRTVNSEGAGQQYAPAIAMVQKANLYLPSVLK